MVQKQEGGEGQAEEARCQQKAEKEFPVLNLVSSDRGADSRFGLVCFVLFCFVLFCFVLFCFPLVELGSICQAREDWEVPRNKRSFGSCLEIFLKISIPRYTRQRQLALFIIVFNSGNE